MWAYKKDNVDPDRAGCFKAAGMGAITEFSCFVCWVFVQGCG
jgi:hypothetical protein